MSERNEILVVGNGYDIANGLKTGFSNYMQPLLCEYIFSYIYHLYSKQSQTTDEYKNILNVFEAVCNIFSQNETTISVPENFFENQFIKILLHKYCPVITLFQAYIEADRVVKGVELDSRQIRIIQGIISKFHFFIAGLFKKINRKALTCDLKWFDVESIIANVINDDLHSDLGKFLTQAEKEDFYSFLKELDLFDKHPFFGENVKNINLQECHEGLELFSESFKNYLAEEQNVYKKRSSNQISEVSDLLKKDSFDYVISLNYTSVFKKALKSDSKNNYCHIHGSLEHNNIVIGTGSYSYDTLVKDPTKTNDMNKIPFYKFFLRILKDTDENYHEWIKDKNYALTFYGFSFGINDYDLIRELFLISDNKGQSLPFINPALREINIYCLNLNDKYKILLNLTACLNKDIVNNLKKILHFVIIQTS